jgi:hypothetical protein
MHIYYILITGQERWNDNIAMLCFIHISKKKKKYIYIYQLIEGKFFVSATNLSKLFPYTN